MAGRVTIQDIADELGISRNTVSKAINNTGVLSESTRSRVLAKAVEMGYKQFSYFDFKSLPKDVSSGPAKNRDIALISTWFLNASHFSSMMLDKFQLEISKAGYSMSMHIARAEDILERRVPASLRIEQCAGIICVEVFDYDYAKMLCGLDIPLLFVDAPASLGKPPIQSDILLMNNSDCIYEFISRMKVRGIEKIAFAGEYLHCRSFFERYMAFRNGMLLCGLPIDETRSILENVGEARRHEAENYADYLRNELSRMDLLPELFICANDFVAIDMMRALDKLGVKVPSEIKLLGFDDSTESRIVTPPLSTIHIHSQILGVSAAQLLLSRMSERALNYRTVYGETELVLRQSTGD